MHTCRYLNYRSEHPHQQKRSVVNTLLHRADTICNDEKDNQAETATIMTYLIENGYPFYVSLTNVANMRRKKKHGLSCITVLIEKLKRCLRSHNIKVVLKPIRKIEDILGSTKDSLNKNLRQGVLFDSLS